MPKCIEVIFRILFLLYIFFISHKPTKVYRLNMDLRKLLLLFGHFITNVDAYRFLVGIECFLGQQRVVLAHCWVISLVP